MSELTRREAWLQKRMGKITSSRLDKFEGKGKKGEYSEGCITYLYGVKRQRRTHVMPEEKTCYNFEWGHSNECLALNWLRTELEGEVKDCATDFENIVFNEPFHGFGDSPDAIHELEGLRSVIEVKSPVDQAEIEMMWEIDRIQETKYYYQCLGHFIGDTAAQNCFLVIWDGYASIGHVMQMSRAECQQDIDALTEKIKYASDMIDESLITGKSLRILLSGKV